MLKAAGSADEIYVHKAFPVYRDKNLAFRIRLRHFFRRKIAELYVLSHFNLDVFGGNSVIIHGKHKVNRRIIEAFIFDDERYFSVDGIVVRPDIRIAYALCGVREPWRGGNGFLHPFIVGVIRVGGEPEPVQHVEPLADIGILDIDFLRFEGEVEKDRFCFPDCVGKRVLSVFMVEKHYVEKYRRGISRPDKAGEFRVGFPWEGPDNTLLGEFSNCIFVDAEYYDVITRSRILFRNAYAFLEFFRLFRWVAQEEPEIDGAVFQSVEYSCLSVKKGENAEY